MASDAVENRGLFIPVGFDLHQFFRKWASLILRAADGRNDPVSLLPSETLAGAGESEHFWLGSRERIMMEVIAASVVVVMVVAALASDVFQGDFGRVLVEAGVPGLDEEAQL